MATMDGVRVKIADLADTQAVIHDVHFTDCDIDGPAVLVPIGSFEFESNVIPGPVQSFFWVLDHVDFPRRGLIGLHDCSFHGCRFSDGNVGVASTEGDISRFVRSFLD